jgi:5-methylcytosine-specific restriction endonuclease McrA
MRDGTPLSDAINLHDVGNTIQLVGAIYSGNEDDYFCIFPDESLAIPVELISYSHLKVLPMDLQEWETFLKQTDLVETEVLTRAKDKTITKAFLRKSERQISSNVQWKVFQRDNYACRYCGLTGIPLTVDHLLLWEEGGPSTQDNLLSACKRCNRIRGSMHYAEWLESQDYVIRSKFLTEEQRQANKNVVSRLSAIRKQVHMRSR